MDNEITIELRDVTSKSFLFSTFNEAIVFLDNEIKFWESKSSEAGREKHSYYNSRNKLTPLLDGIKTLSSQKGPQVNTSLSNYVRQFHNGNNWLFSKHPFTESFTECHKKLDKNGATAFLSIALQSNSSISVNNANGFTGAMLGFEYLERTTPVLSQREGLITDLSRVNSEFLNNSKNLFEATNSFRGDILKWKEQQINEIEKWREENEKKWTSLFSNVEIESNDSRKVLKDDISKMNEICDKEITRLNMHYEETIRLKKPAEYWEKSAKNQRTQSFVLFIGLSALILVGIAGIYQLFSQWLDAKELALKLDTVQGIALFATGVSAYAFLISILSKMLLSSMHLMRDSEEREQLTYLYLSLINETELDEKSREIILQALFSRVDTGLLRGDSSPTMPSVNELSKIFNKQ